MPGRVKKLPAQRRVGIQMDLPELPTGLSPENSLAYYRTGIAGLFYKSTGGVFLLGVWLEAAYRDLGADYDKLFVGKDAVPFGAKHAEKYRAIAKSGHLRANMRLLPPCVATIYELQQLDLMDFEDACRRKRIHTRVKLVEAKMLKAQYNREKAAKGMGTPARPGVLKKKAWKTSPAVWHEEHIDPERRKYYKKNCPENEIHGQFRFWDPNQSEYFSKGYSIQDPAMLEAVLERYIGDAGARVFDVFAGYLTRGFVCAVNGCSYDGWDCWADLVDENKKLVSQLELKDVRYHLGDARVLAGVEGQCDLALFSPPYWHLEEYSGLSECLAETQEFDEFLTAIEQCIRALYPKVRYDGFIAAFVSDVRDKDGWLKDIIGQTIAIFERVGFKYHDRIVLVHPPGAGAAIAENSWRGKKLVHRPDVVLIFKKNTENVDE